MLPRRLAIALAALTLTLFTPTAVAQTSESLCDRFADGAVAGNVRNTRLTEISGLVASRRHPGVYWTHNDSGGKAELFALRLDGTDLGSYALTGASAVDWEDMAIGPKHGATGSFLYAGDIGNNGALAPIVMGEPREELFVYRVAEPTATPAVPGVALSGVEKFTLVYPGGPEDAEAMLVDPVSGDLVIITKSPLGRSRILVAPAASMVNGARITLTDQGVIQIVPVINPSSTFPGTFVTGADISADGSLILVRTYQAVLAFSRGTGESVADALLDGSCNAPQTEEQQGEAIAIAADGSRYATISEGTRSAINVFAIAGAPATTTTTAAPSPSIAGRVLPRSGFGATLPLSVAAAVLLAVLVSRRLIGLGHPPTRFAPRKSDDPG